MIRVVGVKFKGACKVYDFDPADFEIRRGDRVVVDAERGMSLATAATEVREMAEEAVAKGLKKVLRVATPEDMEQEVRNRERETYAQGVCLKKVKEKGLPMKLVNVEYTFDGSKAIFYFTADGRVDFRELVRDLAHEFHIRIEMKQIGVRDAARMSGGMGPCGKELCCSSFLTGFEPVSVKMAKEQGLSLNPAKISGICGRLMCCLSYEYGMSKESGHHLGKHGGGCGGCHGHA
jgi:cell fate regulator YaaT (PSP1 superfamily)